MVSVLICNKNRKECAAIGDNCRDKIAQYSTEKMQLFTVANDSALAQTVESEKPLDLLYYDFQDGSQIDGLRSVKQKYTGAMIMLMAGSDVSPLAYLRPGIAPDALLLKPIQEAQLNEMNQEFVQRYFERTRPIAVKDYFTVNTREEKVVVPYSHIYYFEAREKKLFLRTRYTEYAFYGTIEALENSLESPFQRCHRSYIVNLKKVVRLLPSENILELVDQVTIPVSRSYRSNLKGALL